MLRKLILSAVLATGAIAGISMTASTADAAPGNGYDRDRDYDHGRDRDRNRKVRYEVQVRHGFHWDRHGTYRSRNEAQRIVWALERQGLNARIEVDRR